MNKQLEVKINDLTIIDLIVLLASHALRQKRQKRQKRPKWREKLLLGCGPFSFFSLLKDDLRLSLRIPKCNDRKRKEKVERVRVRVCKSGLIKNILIELCMSRGIE